MEINRGDVVNLFAQNGTGLVTSLSADQVTIITDWHNTFDMWQHAVPLSDITYIREHFTEHQVSYCETELKIAEERRKRQADERKKYPDTQQDNKYDIAIIAAMPDQGNESEMAKTILSNL
jgi:hypothetical protein